jgi:hypothetical protein
MVQPSFHRSHITPARELAIPGDSSPLSFNGPGNVLGRNGLKFYSLYFRAFRCLGSFASFAQTIRRLTLKSAVFVSLMLAAFTLPAAAQRSKGAFLTNSTGFDYSAGDFTGHIVFRAQTPTAPTQNSAVGCTSRPGIRSQARGSMPPAMSLDP